jgi:hypothetical protein
MGLQNALIVQGRPKKRFKISLTRAASSGDVANHG